MATVPAGPLAVRWHGCRLDTARAGTLFDAHVTVENAGTAAWRTDGEHRIEAAYHWLDLRGNPIVWDGYWHPFGRVLAPGDRIELPLRVRAPMPPGRYRLAFDVVSADHFWLSEIGNAMLETDVDVLPRIERPEEAVAHLPAGVEPCDGWQERVLAAHAEGYAVVGSAVEPTGSLLERRSAARVLAPWAPGRGRVPGFPHPLVCPSVLRGVNVAWTEVEGLPAALPPRDEASVHEARAVVRARLRAGRRRG